MLFFANFALQFEETAYFDHVDIPISRHTIIMIIYLMETYIRRYDYQLIIFDIVGNFFSNQFRFNVACDFCTM